MWQIFIGGARKMRQKIQTPIKVGEEIGDGTKTNYYIPVPRDKLKYKYPIPTRSGRKQRKKELKNK